MLLFDHLTMTSSSDLFGIVGKVIAGTYRVEEVVAEGGFGVVYKAHHTGFRAAVALKCLKIPGELGEEQEKRFLEQFRSEAEVLFRLSALLSNVVRPLHVDAFQSDDGRFVPYIALEWLEGWTLDAVIAQRAEQGRPPIALEKLVRLLTPVARALEQAHNMPGPSGTLSIVHRDMKPENLFVALVGGEQLVKILDFGISKVKNAAAAEREGPAMDGPSSFSPAYAAPEQWLPRRYGETGPWTDVWGMALSIVETIKGELVVVGDQAAMMEMIVDPQRRPTPRSEGVKVSDEVEAIFEKALAVNPRDRYRSMSAFWGALLEALELDLLGNPKRASRLDPRVEGRGGGRSEQLEAALSPRLSSISGLQSAAPSPTTSASAASSVVGAEAPSAGLGHGPPRALARVGGGPRPAAVSLASDVEIPRAPATPQFTSKVQRRRQPSHGEAALGADAARAASRTAETEPPAPERLGHRVTQRPHSPLSSTPRRSPARAPALRASPERFWKQLLPALALLALAISITMFDRAYATTNGASLHFGWLRASWVGAGCFVVALVVGVSSVWRSLD